MCFLSGLVIIAIMVYATSMQVQVLFLSSFIEKVKQWHDRRILKREFHIGEKVLLYRSCLRFFAGKLLSKWEGPFVIEEVYRSGAVKIASLKDNTSQVVNGQRLKHYILEILIMKMSMLFKW
jgi:hypothetical protein